MTARIEKTVFISYRRTNFPWAYCIYQDLTHHGFDVFMDYQSIDSGSFERAIIDHIRAKAHFVVILAPSTLERCNEPGDWLRREIETAIVERRNIIPVMLEGFDFGSATVQPFLNGKLESLSTYNGLRLIADYMEEGFEKLRRRYLNVALEDIHLQALTDEAAAITRIQKAAVDEVPSIGRNELAAQEWLGRGYVFASSDDIDEAIRCFSESIRLNPSYDAYYNRGIAQRQKGNFADAIQDYDLAIGMKPDEAETYNNRGNVYRDKGDLDRAISDYNTAIRLNAHATRAFINRGVVKRIQGDIDGALADFGEVLGAEATPEEITEAFYNRGNLLQLKGALEDAIKDYEKALKSYPNHVLARASLSDVLRKLGRSAEANKQAKMARQMAIMEPEYNRACFESILGNTDQALRLLEIGIQSQQATGQWARIDPDFDNIRDDPRFKELVGE